VIHHKLSEDRFSLSFRGGLLGTVDRTYGSLAIPGMKYTFYPIYESVVGDAGHMTAMTIKKLKADVLELIPPDPPPAPGMPVIDV